MKRTLCETRCTSTGTLNVRTNFKLTFRHDPKLSISTSEIGGILDDLCGAVTNEVIPALVERHVAIGDRSPRRLEVTTFTSWVSTSQPLTDAGVGIEVIIDRTSLAENEVRDVVLTALQPAFLGACRVITGRALAALNRPTTDQQVLPVG